MVRFVHATARAHEPLSHTPIAALVAIVPDDAHTVISAVVVLELSLDLAPSCDSGPCYDEMLHIGYPAGGATHVLFQIIGSLRQSAGTGIVELDHIKASQNGPKPSVGACIGDRERFVDVEAFPPGDVEA